MLDEVPSLTAMVVAFARGFSGAAEGAVRDPYAVKLLPRPLAAVLSGARALADGRPFVERALSLATLDTLAHASLRTGEIDAAVESAIRTGARQLVIVGAGLDARAYRLDALRMLRVFEIDHPATQRLKRAKAQKLKPRAKEIIHVAVDFARDSLAEALANAGHDPTVPTVWVWEGVTMYLPHTALAATLEVIGARSAAKSTLVVTYVEPAFSTLPASLVPLMRAVFASIGEPIIGDITPDAMHDELNQRGFVVSSDTTSREWQLDHAFGEAPLVRVLERVAVAEKR
jgi:methyltransferase (TIGR00027 family)